MESNFSLRFRLLVYSWQMIFFIILEMFSFVGLFSIPILVFTDEFTSKMAFFSFAIVSSALITLVHRRYDILKFLETRFGDRKDFLEVIVPKNGLELKIKFQYQSDEHLLKFTPDHFKGGEDEFTEITNYFKNMCT